MPTGNDLIQRVVDLCPEMGDDTGTLTAPESARLVRHLNAEQEKLSGEIAAIGEDYQLVSGTFNTTANRSPNFKDIRYLERIIDEAAGVYERVPPIDHLNDKDRDDVRVWLDLIIQGAPGRPVGYLLGSDFIQIEPICDADYPMRIWYTARYADIVADDTQLISFPAELYDALVLGAAYREKLFRRIFEDAQAMLLNKEIALSQGLANLNTRQDDGPKFINYMDEWGPNI